MMREQIELRKMPDARGGFTIWVDGVQWARAFPRWAGTHGLSHNLQYPGGQPITYTRPSPTKNDPNRVYESEACVDSYKWRGRRDFRVKVEKQPDAIITKFLDLAMAGNVKTPEDRARAAAAYRERTTRQQGIEQARRDRIQLGFSRLWGFALTDDERFALDELYYEAFAVRYSQR